MAESSQIPSSSSDRQTETENRMHDKCKQVVVFHNHLCKFWTSLKGVLPEYLPTIRKAINYYKSCSRAAYLEELQTSLGPHMNRVSTYDECLFGDDYLKGPLYLFPQMNFKELWSLLETEDFQADTELQASTKKSIFNHLQTIYITAQMARDQISLFNKNIEKQKAFLMQMLDNLKMDDVLKNRIEELKAAEAEGNNTGPGGLDKIAEIFGEDNFVCQLAKEVADELDLGHEDISSPVEAITALFADGGKKLRELIVTVTERIEQKVESGEIDRDRLLADAQKMKDKLGGLVGNMPGLEQALQDNAIVTHFQQSYDSLTVEEQEHFGQIPELLEKPLQQWTDAEKTSFDEFAQYLSAGPEEEQLPEDSQPAKPQPKPAAAKAKAKPKGKGPAAPKKPVPKGLVPKAAPKSGPAPKATPKSGPAPKAKAVPVPKAPKADH